VVAQVTVNRFSAGRNSEGHLIIVKPMDEMDTSMDLLFDYMEATIREHPEIDYMVLEVTSKELNKYAPDGGNPPAAMPIREPETQEVPIAKPSPVTRAVKDSPQA
jgi:hypothetical protein